MGGPSRGSDMPFDPSHVTRFAFDASTYDEVCVNCGTTDGHGGKLREPCPKPVGQGGMTIEEFHKKDEKRIREHLKIIKG